VSEPLQLDLLIGRRVYDAGGRMLGRVDEILLCREGDNYAVEGLLIGVNGLAERLGVSRPLERLERRFGFDPWRVQVHIIPWEQIGSIDEKKVQLNVDKREISTFQPED
jgi:sporulation protein YlmC with PRC-barrel domain